MGAVEASQLSALSWQPPWEVLFLVVALAIAQVSLLLTVIILSITIMNQHRAILNNHNHPHNHHQQVAHPHPQVIFYLCLPTVLKLCTPAGLNLSLLATIHYSLVTFTFFRDFTLSWFLFCLSLLTFDFTSHFHFSIPMTKTLPTCHHSLLIIGNFHFSESLFTSDFTNQ